MSTRIYKGFYVADDSISRIHDLMEAFRPWLVKQARAQQKKFVGTLGTIQDWSERRRDIARLGHRDPAVDTDFTLAWIPSSSFLTLGICFTEQESWWRKWLRQPDVHEYGFWNNTDRPDGVSASDWLARERVWSVLDHRPVKEQALCIELTSQEPTWPWRD